MNIQNSLENGHHVTDYLQNTLESTAWEHTELLCDTGYLLHKLASIGMTKLEENRWQGLSRATSEFGRCDSMKGRRIWKAR